MDSAIFQDNQQNAAQSQAFQSSRQWTAQQMSKLLGGCIIPMKGDNQLALVGLGVPHTQDNGTAVRIFNVAAFADVATREKAKQAFLRGYALEKAGDIAGAQLPYREARNCMMSFNVREENAAAFTGVFKINCLVEEVETKDRNKTLADGVTPNPNFGKAIGKTLGINSPRPVAITQRGASSVNEFAIPDAPPVQVPAQPTPSNVLTEEEKQLLNAGADDTNP